jgi:hypothetical protein
VLFVDRPHVEIEQLAEPRFGVAAVYCNRLEDGFKIGGLQGVGVDEPHCGDDFQVFAFEDESGPLAAELTAVHPRRDLLRLSVLRGIRLDGLNIAGLRGVTGWNLPGQKRIGSLNRRPDSVLIDARQVDSTRQAVLILG